MLNPFPHFYGEVLLYEDLSNNYSEDSFEISDFGRIPNLRHINLPQDILNVLSQENISVNCEFNKDTKVSFLQGNLFDLNHPPISESDLNYIIKAILNIDGIATLKVLPYNQYDYKTFSSSILKIIKLPLKDIGYEDLPLNIKINQKLKNLKREKIYELYKTTLNKSVDQKEQINIENLVNHEEFSLYFDTKDFFTIEAYEFPHLIKYYNFFSFKTENIMRDLAEIMKILNITNESKKGMVVLFTKNYMFVAPLVKPYIYSNDIPLYADPHFFAGLFTLPLIEAEWPHTTEGKYLKFDYEEILKVSTTE